jgi:orotidine-5'-phosphate decarboxylase
VVLLATLGHDVIAAVGVVVVADEVPDISERLQREGSLVPGIRPTTSRRCSGDDETASTSDAIARCDDGCL